jgi:hypothetical protein
MTRKLQPIDTHAVPPGAEFLPSIPLENVAIQRVKN